MTSRQVQMLLLFVLLVVVCANGFYFGVGSRNGAAAGGSPSSAHPEEAGAPGEQLQHQPGGDGSPGLVVDRREAVTATDLTFGDDWGRNPFLTAAEARAIGNGAAGTSAGARVRGTPAARRLLSADTRAGENRRGDGPS